QAVSCTADRRVLVDYEEAFTHQLRTRLAAKSLGACLGRGHRLPDFVDHLLDVAGILQDVLESLDYLWLVANVALHNVHRVVQNDVDRHRHGAMDRLDTGGGGSRLLGREQFERVEGDRHIAAEYLK